MLGRMELMIRTISSTWEGGSQETDMNRGKILREGVKTPLNHLRTKGRNNLD